MLDPPSSSFDLTGAHELENRLTVALASVNQSQDVGFKIGGEILIAQPDEEVE